MKKVYITIMLSCSAHIAAHVAIENNSLQDIPVDVTLLASDGVNENNIFLQNITIAPNTTLNPSELTGGHEATIQYITIQFRNQYHRFELPKKQTHGTITVTNQGIKTSQELKKVSAPSPNQVTQRQWGIKKL